MDNYVEDGRGEDERLAAAEYARNESADYGRDPDKLNLKIKALVRGLLWVRMNELISDRGVFMVDAALNIAERHNS
jgi:hypothetical protein